MKIDVIRLVAVRQNGSTSFGIKLTNIDSIPFTCLVFERSGFTTQQILSAIRYFTSGGNQVESEKKYEHGSAPVNWDVAISRNPKNEQEFMFTRYTHVSGVLGGKVDGEREYFTDAEDLLARVENWLTEQHQLQPA